MLPQRLSMVTLGVADVARSKAFYAKLGFTPATSPNDTVAFFQMSGTVLGLYGRAALAEDAAVDVSGRGFRGVSIAMNFDSETEVDTALAHAARCGATLTKPAQKVFWGGYSGYFADPDGHLWEIAHNPFAPNDAAGHMQLTPKTEKASQS